MQARRAVRIFSYFLEKFPGVYAFVGCRNESKDCCYSLHNERFDLDEDAW